MSQYTQKELRKLFDTLPQELKDAILSEETAGTIRQICQRNQVKEKDISKVAEIVGNVLMGLLSPKESLISLEKELGLDKEKTQSIFREITRFILFPLKNLLIEFYPETKFVPGGRIETKKIEDFSKSEEPIKEQIDIDQEKIKEQKTDDIYREILE